MNMQKNLDNAVGAERAKTFARGMQLSLGELIAKVEPIAANQKGRIDDKLEEADVYFDFEYLYPVSLCSWRGSYSELSIEFGQGQTALTVTRFLDMLKESVGKSYCGYKGGDFVMSRQTPVWVANYGNAGNTGVIGVLDLGYRVIIQTGYTEF